MIKDKITVSLVILTYNEFIKTKNCIDSILSHRNHVKLEIILVDNGSSDGSEKKLLNLYKANKNFVFLKRNKNEYITPAYNDGFYKSRGQIIIFMNNDIIVTKNWLQNLINVFSDKNIGIAGPVLLDSKKNNIIDSTGCNTDLFGYPHPLGKGKKYHKKNLVREVFCIPGAIIAVKKDIFIKTGGFDGLFGGNYEDVDLSWRAKLLGYKTVVAHDSAVYHIGSWTVKNRLIKTDVPLPFSTRLSYFCRRNRLATLIKNGSTIYLLIMLPLYLLFQVAIFLKESILDRNMSLAKTTPLAILWNLKNIKYFLEKRRSIYQKKTVSDWKILTEMYPLNYIFKL